MRHPQTLLVARSCLGGHWWVVQEAILAESRMCVYSVVIIDLSDVIKTAKYL